MQLASLFTDHLVLQQQRENPIWGRDRPGQELTLELSGPSELRLQARADASGYFSFRCPALPAGGPHRLTLTGSERVVLADVWVGEVWLASGQSNMEWPVRAAAHANEELARAEQPGIRAFKVARSGARTPASSVEGEWTPCGPDTVGAFSAVGHAFARELHARLGVAVGIIDATWGGTSIDAWLSVEALGQVDDTLKARLDALAAQEQDLPRLRAEHSAAVRAWEIAKLPSDPPNVGQRRGWQRADFDDSEWHVMQLPSFWQHHGLAFNGVVWFRRELELPAQAAGQELELELGPIDDYDHTYFNGTLVGSHPDGTPDAFQLPRRYRVPAGLVRPGKNTLAVRVFDHVGEGGFVGPGAAMRAHNASGLLVRLDGAWRYAVEHQIPLVSGDVFASFPQPPLALMQQGAPGALHNGMLAPLFPFGVRGVIWYQGETDAEAHASYAARQVALIRDLRKHFAEPNLAFLLVQLAGFRANACWPFLREAQHVAAREPGAGLVSALDVGEPQSIHPLDKRTIGTRLAWLARAQVYGERELMAHSPTLAQVELTGDTARVSFEHGAGLRTRDAGAVRGFMLAGADGIFQKAHAKVTGETALVQSARVPAPRFVRYGWADFSDANLENAAGLPALPFRSDALPCPNHG